MEMGAVQNIMATHQADTMSQVNVALQKKAMDMMKLQGEMLQEMMASMGVGQNLDVKG